MVMPEQVVLKEAQSDYVFWGCYIVKTPSSYIRFKGYKVSFNEKLVPRSPIYLFLCM